MRIDIKTPDQQHQLCTEESGLLVGNRERVGEYEQFTVEQQGGNTYALRSVTTNRFLSFLSPEECRARNVPVYSVMGTANYVDIWERLRVEKFRYGVTFYCPYWDKYLSAQNYGGGQVLGNGPEPTDWEVFVPSDYSVFNLGGSPVSGKVDQLQGLVDIKGKSFKDESGPRIVHGCSDFGAIIKYHENRDSYLKTLDTIAAHQQFVRVAWRLNGGLWESSGLTVDPIEHTWWADAVRGLLKACSDRNLRVNLSCMDMYNWSEDEAYKYITQLAQIAESVSHEVVILHEWNEMRGTVPGGESESGVNLLRDLTRKWQEYYPWCLRGLSDPGSQDKTGMKNLAQDPANVAIIHNVRWYANDAIRRAFNAVYENWPDKPIVEGEPTGPNGSPPHNAFTRQVYQPIEEHDDLLAIYTQHILSGQMSTYFNDPALYSREPIDSTWGFKEIPELWRKMEIPENIGQGELFPGHWNNAPLQVIGSNAERADGTEIDGEFFGIISGGNNWKVKSGRDGELTLYQASGEIHYGRISAGERIPADGPIATEVRIRY